MSDAWQSIKIREFEYVLTGADTCLLRLSGKAGWRRAAEERPILLVQADDGEDHRFEPLRAPTDRGGVLRTAYAVPAELVTPASQFWLEHPGGRRTELPPPEEGVARMGSASTLAEADVFEPVPVAPEPAAREEPAARPELVGASEVELAHARELVGVLEARIAELERSRGGDVQAATEAASAAQARAEASEQRADAAEQRADAARRDAASAVAEVESLSQKNADLRATAEQLNATAAQLEKDLADVAPAKEMLEREVAEMRSRRVSLERELDQARDQLRIMTFERDELSRQAAAFDGIAVKARDRATRAEAQNERTSATLRELETWRGELERRLAETTSELGSARAARDADERELHRLRSALADAETTAGAGNGADASDAAQTVAAQAEEIERLAAELAVLRARASDAERSNS